MKPKPDNFLDYIPQRAVEWKTEENGRVCLIKEKTRRRWLKKLIGMLRRSHFFHIHLDELGSAAWQLADGQKSILEIAGMMASQFGDRVEPVFPRVSQFFAIMKRNGFVSLGMPAPDGTSGNAVES